MVFLWVFDKVSADKYYVERIVSVVIEIWFIDILIGIIIEWF